MACVCFLHLSCALPLPSIRTHLLSSRQPIVRINPKAARSIILTSRQSIAIVSNSNFDQTRIAVRCGPVEPKRRKSLGTLIWASSKDDAKTIIPEERAKGNKNGGVTGPGFDSSSFDENEIRGTPWDWTEGPFSKFLLFGLLFSVPAVPYLPVLPFSAPLYFMSLALWAVYVGSHRSLNAPQMRPLTLQQSLLVPVFCSVTLFSFYMLLKLFPDFSFSLLLSAYLSLIGALSVAGNLSEPMKSWIPATSAQAITVDFPEWLFKPEEGESVTASIAIADVIAFSVGALLTVYSFQEGAPFSVSNFIAVCLASEFLSTISMGSVSIAACMMVGLLLYDVFWVFGSSNVFGDNVMLTVATSNVMNGPMKFVYPSLNASSVSEYSILGLGDVALPGLMIALMLRFDKHRCDQSLKKREETPAYLLSSSPSPITLVKDSSGILNEGNIADVDKAYFNTSVASYILGLIITIGVNSFTGAAQPALLYLVPSLLLGVVQKAYFRDELEILFQFSEVQEASKEEDTISSER